MHFYVCENTKKILSFHVTQLTSCCNIEVGRAIAQAASHYEGLGSLLRQSVCKLR